MDQPVTSEESVNPLRMEQKALNGLSSLLPALGTQDVNKNHQDNILTRTVENVIRGLDRTNPAVIEHRDGLLPTRPYLADHASQLLKAASAAVIRSGRGLINESDGYTSPNSLSNDDAASSLYYQHYEIGSRLGNNASNTTLSYSSKPAMSTGYNDYVAANSKTKLPSSVNSVSAMELVSSTKVNPDIVAGTRMTTVGAKETLVPFLWQRTCNDTSVSYTR